MNGYERQAKRRPNATRLMSVVLAVLLFTGLFVQISLLARISSENKQIAKVQNEINDLNANAQNLAMSINQYHDLREIAIKAINLGMHRPSDTQIRVVNVAYDSNQNTSTQMAAAGSAEEIRN